VGRTDEAIRVLQSIIQNNTSVYVSEAKYALALGYLKRGDMQNTKKHLDEYLKDGKGRRNEEAQQLQIEINPFLQ
jgi:Tfp pilus assembly protein PilF